MASILLTAAGAALGGGLPGVGFLAGPLLGLAGSFAGGALDNALGLTPRASGRRLTSLKVQDSREGAPIPRIYGTMRAAGNVIWSSDLIETRRSTRVGGGKGGSANATSYQYSVHMAVGICAGPVAGLLRVWADSKLIYDAQLNTTYAGALRFYNGSSTQTADALLQSYLGASNTPAFRGTAYVVLENVRLEHFGNRIPNLTFEIEGISGGFQPATLASTTHTAGVGAGAATDGRVFATSPTTLVAIGCRQISGQYRFVAEHYSYNGSTLLQTARVTSNALSGYFNQNYALSPDGRTIACINCLFGTGDLALYTLNTQSFSAIHSPTLDVLDSFDGPLITWADNTTILAGATYNGANAAVLLFRRGGNSIINTGTPPRAVLSTNIAAVNHWPGVAPAWLLGTQTLFLHNGTFNSLSMVRVQMQNGTLQVAELPPVSLGAHVYRPLAVANDEIVVAAIDAGNSVFSRYAVSSTGLSLLNSSTLGIDGSEITTLAALPNNRLCVLTDDSTLYKLTEVSYNSTGFSISGTQTTLAGLTPSVSVPRLARYGGNTLMLLTDTALALLTPRRGDNTLPGIISDLCGLLNISTLDTTAAGTARVPGFAITDVATARDVLETLQDAYNFAVIESDAQLKVSAFASATPVTITAAVRRASSNNGGDNVPPLVARSRTQAQELPTAVQVDYLDATLDYNSASRVAARQAPPYALLQRLSLPLALNSNSAQEIADTRLARTLAEQESITITVSRAHAALDCGDVISVDGNTYRITNLAERGGVIEIQAVRHITASLSASNALLLNGSSTALVPQAAALLALDLPALSAAENQPGIYFAATGPADWRGGIVYRSLNAEAPVEYARLAGLAVAGIALDALGTGPTEYFDNANSVTVGLTSGTLSTVSELAVLNGANTALLGDEIIQFKTATLVAENTYQLSGLLRGRRGTDHTVGTHTAGERFLLLDSASLVFAGADATLRGTTASLQLLTTGQTLAEALPFDITYQFRTLAPFSPAQLQAQRIDGGGDITFRWVRRARVNAEWLDYADVPLDEDSEDYVLEVLDGSNIVRSFNISNSTSQLYTIAQQTTDFGSPPASISFQVAQIGTRYGRGFTASTSITF